MDPQNRVWRKVSQLVGWLPGALLPTRKSPTANVNAHGCFGRAGRPKDWPCSPIRASTAPREQEASTARQWTPAQLPATVLGDRPWHHTRRCERAPLPPRTSAPLSPPQMTPRADTWGWVSRAGLGPALPVKLMRTDEHPGTNCPGRRPGNLGADLGPFARASFFCLYDPKSQSRFDGELYKAEPHAI